MQLDEGSRNPIRVVVVSEEILERLRPFPSLLRRANVRFLLAYSGSEALTLAGASDPALLLLDYALPVLRADEVCRELKASPKLSGIPVVIVGPAFPPEFELSCRKAGCAAYLPTPVEISALAPLLARLLGLPNREESRLPVLLSVTYGMVISQSLGRSRDLSLAGIQVRSLTRFQKGFCVNLRFSLGEEAPVTALGEIVRVMPTEEGDYDVGIRFVGLPAETRTRLAEFLVLQRT